MSGEPPGIIRLSGIGRTYGGADGTDALSGVDLTIRAGEFVAIVGRSGSGKSTLLNLLGLLDTATSGEYWVDGVLTSDLAEKERDELRAQTFGFVFQDSHMLLKETVGRNAALGLVINEVDPPLRAGIVARALANVGMLDKAQHLARNLSGGERQRVAIARATATAPRILLADEPTGALDTANSSRVMETFRALNTAGVTVVLITHDPEIAAEADRIITLSDGLVESDLAVGETVGHRLATPLALPAQTQTRWSRLSERVLSAISNHTVHVARAALLLVAFTVGAAGLVAATGLSQTAAGQIDSRFAAEELDKFYVVPSVKSESVRAQLGLAGDAGNLEVASIAEDRLSPFDGVTGVGLIAEASFDGEVTLLNATQVREQPELRPTIFAADGEYLHLQGVRVAELGDDAMLRFFDRGGEYPGVVLGASFAERIGISAGEVGARLWIAGSPVAVLGVLADAGEEPRFETAVIANPALAAALDAPDFSLLVAVEPGGAALVADRVGVAITPGDPTLFTAETVADLNTLKRGVADDLLSLISLIAWVLLGLSSLSAATATYLSVHARTTEIALRRALGESRRAVWRQFVLEGVTIGTLGGVVGSAVGVVLIVGISGAQGWQPTFGFLIVGIGVLTGAITGIVASLYPAAIAARQDPALGVRGN